MKVAVVYGGQTDEHEVSRASAADVIASLRTHPDLHVAPVFVDRAGLWHPSDDRGAGIDADRALAAFDADGVVFPVLHGGWGEGGGLQATVERHGRKLVGSGSAAAAAGLSKPHAQRLWDRAGLPVIPTVAITRERFRRDPDGAIAAIERAVTGQVVVKPASGGSSLGVHITDDPRRLRNALDDALGRDEVALAQPRLTGHEVSVGVWDDEAGMPQATGASLLHLPPAAQADGFTYAHKYEGAGGELEIPAAFPDALLRGLQESAVRAYEVLGCRDLARVDFFVTDEGAIVLNEINTMPGLRRASHFPRLVAAAGTGYDRLLRGLVDAAAARAGAEPACQATPTHA